MLTPDRARLKTPAGDGDVLVEPGGEWRPAVERWRRDRDAIRLPVPFKHPRGLLETAGDVRAALLADLATAGHTLDPHRPLIVTGHQPEFYHAGVLAKNLATDLLAKRWGGRGVNLIVDNDAPNHTAVTFPCVHRHSAGATLHTGATQQTGAGLEVHPVAIPLPTWQRHFAWEHAGRLSSQTWQRIAEVASYTASSLDQPKPIAELFCRAAADHAGDTTNYVAQFVAGLQAASSALGGELTHVRNSVLADTPTFRAWVDALVADADAFVRQYNAALQAYRKRYGFAGTQRPIPNLAVEPGLVELPFWSYTAQTARDRLVVQTSGDGWPRQPDVLIRPRALSLTLFVRLFFADLFIHGIGGAKYDEVTDDLIRTYFHLNAAEAELPPMVCVSATVRLSPAAHIGELSAKVKQQRQHLRRARFNPTLLPGPDSTLAHQRLGLAAQSDRLRQETPADRRQRHATYSALRQATAELLAERSQAMGDLEQELAATERALNLHRALGDREVFFGLVSQQRLLDLAQVVGRRLRST